MLKNLNPFLKYKFMFSSNLMISSCFSYAYKRLDLNKDERIIAMIRKSELKAHCYAARTSFGSSPGGIAKTIQALISD